MKLYRVTSPLSRSKVSYIPGQKIELDDDTADRMITAGLVEAPAGHKTTPKKAGNNPGAAGKTASTKKKAAESKTDKTDDASVEVEVS